MNEFDLIGRYFAGFPVSGDVVEGIGDDAAVLAVPDGKMLVQTTDTLISGAHFPDDAAPADIAHKALMVNLSDIAAMGAKPLWFTLSLTLPNIDQTWLAAFSAQLKDLSEQYQLSLVGGDTTSGPLSVGITMTGSVNADAYVLRSGAVVADDIYVSGTIGDAALGLSVWQGRDASGFDQTQVLERFHRPNAQVALGQALGGVASSMIDCSDGLFADLSHILERSKVGAELNIGDVPVSASVSHESDSEQELLGFLNGGDDYELIFTAASEKRDAIAALGKRLDCPLHRIGVIAEGSELVLRGVDNDIIENTSQGYKHFG